jgi:H+/Cl- antiporter ClcA
MGYLMASFVILGLATAGIGIVRILRDTVKDYRQQRKNKKLIWIGVAFTIAGILGMFLIATAP